MLMNNILIQADNLIGLKYLLNECKLKNKVDLIYIDPPYATGAKFVCTEQRSATISRRREGILAYSDELSGKDYLEFIRERLLLAYELLSERGSIYVHHDFKVGSYVNTLLGEIFGEENYRNNIVRIKCNPKNFPRVGYGNITDQILFYTKSSNPIWHEPKLDYSDEEIARLYPKTDSNGRSYTTVPLHAPGETKKGATSMPFKGLTPPKGRHWRADIETLEEWDAQGLIEWSSTGNPRKKIFADEQTGKRAQDVWEFKDPPYPVYPTEKNLEMLKLIVSTSSDEDSVVLDFFCGSGTTLKAAQLLGRRWIGIDSSERAIQVAKEKIGSIKPTLWNDQNEYDYIELTTQDEQGNRRLA